MRRTTHFYIITCMTFLLLKCARSDHDGFFHTHPIEPTDNNATISDVCKHIPSDKVIDALNAINAPITEFTTNTQDFKPSDATYDSYPTEGIRRPVRINSVHRFTESQRRSNEPRDFNRRQLLDQRTNREIFVDQTNQRRDVRTQTLRAINQRETSYEHIHRNPVQFDRRRSVFDETSDARKHLSRVTSVRRARNVRVEFRHLSSRYRKEDRNNRNIRRVEHLDTRNIDLRSNERKNTGRLRREENTRGRELSVDRSSEVHHEARNRRTIKSIERRGEFDRIRREERRNSVSYSEEYRVRNTDVERRRGLVLADRRDSMRYNTDRRSDIHRQDRSPERQTRVETLAEYGRRQSTAERLESRCLDERQEIRRMDNVRRYENTISRIARVINKRQTEQSNTREGRVILTSDRIQTRQYEPVERRLVRSPDERRTMTRMYESAETRLVRSPDERRTLTYRYESAERRLVRSPDERCTLTHRYESTERRLVRSQDERRTMTHRYESTERRLVRSQDEKRTLTHRYESAERRLVRSTDERRTLTHRYESAERRLVRSTDERRALTHRYESAERRFVRSPDERLTLTRQYESAERRLVRSPDERRTLTHRYESAERRLVRSPDERLTLTRQYESAERQLVRSPDERRTLTHRYESAERRLVRSTNDRRFHTHDVDRVSRRMSPVSVRRLSGRRDMVNINIQRSVSNGDRENTRSDRNRSRFLDSEYRRRENMNLQREGNKRIGYQTRLDDEMRERIGNSEDGVLNRRLQRRMDRHDSDITKTKGEQFSRDGYNDLKITDRMGTIGKRRVVRDIDGFHTSIQKFENQDGHDGLSKVWTGYHSVLDQNGITRAIVVGFIGIIGRGIWQKQA